MSSDKNPLWLTARNFFSIYISNIIIIIIIHIHFTFQKNFLQYFTNIFFLLFFLSCSYFCADICKTCSCFCHSRFCQVVESEIRHGLVSPLVYRHTRFPCKNWEAGGIQPSPCADFRHICNNLFAAPIPLEFLFQRKRNLFYFKERNRLAISGTMDILIEHAVNFPM